MLIRILLLLDLSLWLGSSAYFTIMAANELFGALPIDQAASAVGVLFPPFFTLCAVLGVLGWLLYVLVGRTEHARGAAFRTGWVLLFLSALMSLVNRLVMLPKIQSIEDQMGPVSKASGAMLNQFGMWHGISLLMAMITLGFVVIVWILICVHVKFTWQGGPDRV